MMEIDGYHAQQKVKITFADQEIVVGNKRIKTKDIYDIKLYYLTNFSKLLKVAPASLCIAIVAFINLMVSDSLSLGGLVLALIPALIYSYYLRPKHYQRKTKDCYIKTLNIFFNDNHVCVLIKGGIYLDEKNYIYKPLGVFEKKRLKKYQNNIKHSLSYLMQILEFDKSLACDKAWRKYYDVSQTKYNIVSLLSLKAVKCVYETYQKLMLKENKVLTRIMMIAIVLIIGIFIYLITNRQIEYQTLF